MRNFKVIMIMVVILSLFTMMFTSCSNENNTTSTKGTTATAESTGTKEKTKVRLAGIKGPTGLGMSKLMKDNEDGTANNDYEIFLTATPDEIVAKVTSGTVDIAAIPTNLAANLYNKTNKNVQLAALNTLGVLYIIENGNAISKVEDLRGKTIYASVQGSTTEFILNFILNQNGIDPAKDVNIVWSEEHSALVALCAANTASIAILPEPNVTTVLSKNDKFRIALDITKEYEAACTKANISGSFLAMGGIIVNKDFAVNNKEALDKFLEEYKASAEYTVNNVDEAAELAVKYTIIGSAEIAKKAIPNCNITYIDGDEMKTGIKQFYEVLFEAEPKSIGGSLPGEDFYYSK